MHWPCVTDNSGITTYGLTASEREMSTPPIPSRGMAQFTFNLPLTGVVTLTTLSIRQPVRWFMTTDVVNSCQQVIVSCLSVCFLLTAPIKNCSSILYSFVEWLGEGHLKSNWLTLGDRDSRPTSTVVQMSKFFLPAQSAVFATATWLAGCLSHTSIVSKWLKLS